jgi:hypothetical protein
MAQDGTAGIPTQTVGYSEAILKLTILHHHHNPIALDISEAKNASNLDTSLDA